MEEVLERINRMPEIHAVVYKDVRRALTRRFPYAIYYRIETHDIRVIELVLYLTAYFTCILSMAEQGLGADGPQRMF